MGNIMESTHGDPRFVFRISVVFLFTYLAALVLVAARMIFDL